MACLNEDGKQLENQPDVTCAVGASASSEPIDYTLKKPRRSYVMEDLGEVRHNMSIEKWIMDQVELKLCRNKEELFKDLREKDFAIQKLQDELENLRISKEQPQLKSSNLPKALKGAFGGKPCEIDTKVIEKTNSATLKRAIKIDDKSAVSTTATTLKTRTMTSTTTTKLNSETVKGKGRGLYRSKTLRGESSTSKDNRNVGQPRPFKVPDDKKQLANFKKGSSQESQLDQCSSNSAASRQAEGALAIDSEMAANLKRLTDEHSKLQAEYARVRTLLIEANTKCASGMTSPIPPEKDVATSADQPDQSKCLTINVDVDKQQVNDTMDVEFNDGSREGFRREVLRLKEELLASQHQCRILSDSKSQLEQDLNERENILLQFSKQVEQMNVQHAGVVSEKESTIVRLTQTINDLNEKITEIETEFNETKEFMQEENNSLTEALRDLEEKTWQNSSDMEKLHYQLQTKEKSCDVLSKMVDQAQAQLHELQSELNEKQDNAHNLIVTQGAELNDVSCAVKQLHELVVNIRDRLIDDASTFGVDIKGSPDRKTKSRRSNEGRRLVQAILEAAKGEVPSETSRNDSECSFSSSNESQHLQQSPDVSHNHIGGSKHSSHVREVYTSVLTLGKMVGRFTKFTISLLDEAEEEKKKLESDSRMARIRSEEFQREVEDNCRKRWSIEERNKDLTKELSETRTSLRDARESLRDMWTAVDEKASWLIENKKLREEIAMQRNEFSQMEAERNLLLDELRDLKCQMDSTTTHMNGNGEVTEIKNDPLIFKQQIVNMQRLILNKDEEYQDAKKKHERLMQTMNKNLQVAEKEVQKLDKIIDHVLQVLLNAHDLDLHPVLQQLWKDLDGPGYVATKFDEAATIV